MQHFRVRDKKTGEWVSGTGRYLPLTSPDESEALTLFSAREAWTGYLDFEVIDRRIPQVNDNYPGFCCQGFSYLICLILLDERNIGRTEIYGVCWNPICPIGEDHWRGVGNCDLDDFEERLEKKGVSLAAQVEQ